MTEQQSEALDKANLHRKLRKALKADIKNRRATAKAYILAPPEFCLTMTVYDLLMAKRGWGKDRVTKLLRTCGVSTTKEIGALTDRQRNELLRRLAW